MADILQMREICTVHKSNHKQLFTDKLWLIIRICFPNWFRKYLNAASEMSTETGIRNVIEIVNKAMQRKSMCSYNIKQVKLFRIYHHNVRFFQMCFYHMLSNVFWLTFAWLVVIKCFRWSISFLYYFSFFTPHNNIFNLIAVRNPLSNLSKFH